jgi:CubicO group peptidase (beta-lactamase class C family)
MIIGAGALASRMTTSTPLPASTPAAEGVDAAGIHAFLDAVENSPVIEPHSLMLLRHGRLVASGWWAPFGPDRWHLLYSLSKSFMSTALGLAVGEGLLGLDDRVVDFFPEYAELVAGGNRATRVRDLAAMSSGHTRDTWMEVLTADVADPVRAFLRLPPEEPPGSVFAYNQPANYTVATIIQRLTGGTLVEYLRPRLFDPLGIGPVAWDEHPPGRNMGFTGLFTTTDAIARLGQLYLRRGEWQGRRILSEEWVAEATRPHVATESPNPDWAQGYGFQFWMARHGFRGDGARGQFCLVLPDQDAVVAYTGATEDMQAVLDAAWSCLLPACGDTVREPSAADATLADRLAALSLPPLPAGPPAGAGPWRLAPVAGTGNDRPALTGVEVAGGGTGVVLREADGELRVPVGAGEWAVAEPDGVPVAASGGRTGGSTFAFDVLFLETPHQMLVTCDLAAGTFDARWNVPPLRRPGLRWLRAPRAGDRRHG